MSASLILPCSNPIPDCFLDWVVCQHRKQNKAELEIIISNYGERQNPNILGLDEFITIRDNGTKVNVSKARNMAAVKSKSEWLIFSDIDTVYDNPNTFLEMIKLAKTGIIPCVAGRTRRDFRLQDGIPVCCGYTYPCNHGPIVIRKDLFLSIGGYCEEYSGWGFEDIDFANKIGTGKTLSYSALGSHILDIHMCYMSNPEWMHDSDNNKDIFEQRQKKTIEQCITEDRIKLAMEYNDLKC